MSSEAEVVVKTAESPDISDVLRFWGSVAGPTRLPSDERAVAELIAWDSDALLLAHEGDRLVGTLIAAWDGWRFVVYRLAVDPMVRRRGIASLLLNRARERARGLGARRIDAMVDDDNTAAIAFWESRGFVRQGGDTRWTSPAG